MKKNSFIKVFPHILIWCIALAFPLFASSRNGFFELMPYMNMTIHIVMFFILFYINYLYLIDKLLFEKKYITFLAINVVLIAVIVMVQSYISDALMPFSERAERMVPPDIEQMPKKHGPPKPSIMMRTITDYLTLVFIVGLGVAIKSMVRWNRDSMNMEKMRSEQLEADLKNLQSQLNPHFLFNTLNNIYALIAIDSKKAQESVHRLSNLLRYVLYENDMLFVPIEKDIKFTENYIDLMRLRTVPNTDISILIKCENSTDKIAPLMFMTLIENAFKHGMNSTEHSFIDIKILVENGKGVMCSIENSIGEKDNMESNRTGIGLANLTKRLKLLYPNNHEFVIEKKNDRFSAFLRVDFTKK